MGCSISEEAKHSAKVDQTIDNDAKTDETIVKLLFLGSGGSGKSTFFKQLKCIHSTGFDNKYRKDHRRYISVQIIENFMMAFELIDDEPESLSFELTDDGQQSREYIENIVDGDYMYINKVIGQHCKLLWNEKVIQEIYNNRYKYHLDDSLSYFMDNKNFQRLEADDYIPTDTDILLCRYRTTGVLDMNFKIDKTRFHIFDVGGQKSERKKWIHCFDNVKAVIFVASLSCYDELMFEDNNQNAMIDSLTLFEKVLNIQWFQRTSIILFLNKKDLFEQKIKNTLLNNTFPEINNLPIEKQPTTFNQCVDYIKDKFHEKNVRKSRFIHVHVTTATNKDNVTNIFNDVQNIIVNAGLERNNLI